MMKLFSIGYGNRKPAEFLELLKANGIKAVIDVRKKDSKGWCWEYTTKRLPIELEKLGIKYDNLYLLSNKFVQYSLDDSLRLYKNWLLGTNEADDILEDIKFNIEHYYENNVAIMCACLKSDKCHRKFIVDELAKRLKVSIIDL